MKQQEIIMNLVQKDRKLFFDKIFNCLSRFIINDLKKYNNISVVKEYKLEKNIVLRNIVQNYPYIFISHFGEDPLLLLLDKSEVKFLFDYILHSVNRDILKGVDKKNKVKEESSIEDLTDIEYRILRMFTNHIFKSVVSALKFKVMVDYKPVVCDLKDNETIYLAVDKGFIFNLKLIVNDISSCIRIFMPSSFIESLLLDFNIRKVERVKGDKNLKNSISSIKDEVKFVVELKEFSANLLNTLRVGDKININTSNLEKIAIKTLGMNLGYCSLGKTENRIAVQVNYILTEGF